MELAAGVGVCAARGVCEGVTGLVGEALGGDRSREGENGEHVLHDAEVEVAYGIYEDEKGMDIKINNRSSKESGIERMRMTCRCYVANVDIATVCTRRWSR